MRLDYCKPEVVGLSCYPILNFKCGNLREIIEKLVKFNPTSMPGFLSDLIDIRFFQWYLLDKIQFFNPWLWLTLLACITHFSQPIIFNFLFFIFGTWIILMNLKLMRLSPTLMNLFLHSLEGWDVDLFHRK